MNRRPSSRRPAGLQGRETTGKLPAMATELVRRRDVASRIRALRGTRPQPQVAAEVGVSVRAYQQWEAGGGIAWPNLQRLADIYGVTTNWLENGDTRPEAARSQLDRIERKLDELLGRFGAVEVGDLFESHAGEPDRSQDERLGSRARLRG
jgi:transcriptional regulator with XRE-family HTH domain